jgi:hypothetical protein
MSVTVKSLKIEYLYGAATVSGHVVSQYKKKRIHVKFSEWFR